MENFDAGKWSDSLSCDEVKLTKECADGLSDKNNWYVFLNSKYIKNAINVTANSNRSNNELTAIKSALFEIRVAFLIYKSGLNAEYEFKPNTSIMTPTF